MRKKSLNLEAAQADIEAGGVSDQPAQDLGGLPAQRILGVGDAGALVFELAVTERSPAVPAATRRDRLCPDHNAAALLVACEIDDVLHWPYDFLNHWNSRGSFASVMAESRRANVQCTAQILAERQGEESGNGSALF